ncbi:Sirohydrochlorin cobaltochelatase [Prochlorococcus marinus str. SS35]|uniref:sirohydrochlorin chelatase n=1 Tax=Prochlorococcus marinus TaxID=1219 RepID=UPI00053393AD|nr:sirohydrochlorin chelatase [Prochlorococcus marinus]KGG23679.1 Sirohydrochlorin cobaltochelatase [Prochlorococcus marinus str. SS35]
MISGLFDKLDSNIGILIIGHGSRNSHATDEFATLAERIKASLSNIPVEYGYLEFSCPTIANALDTLRGNSVKKVIALPAMLFAAGHAKNDIPAVLNDYSLKTGLEIIYGKELGIDNSMVCAAGERIKESINSKSEFPLNKTLLVVVGRGSSDPDANSNVSKLTRMLVESFGFAWGETVYSGVTFPLVEPGLRKLVKLGFSRIVVFPYFLFSGVLVSRIRKYVQLVALDNPDIEFINAGYLGNHSKVRETFISRISEAFTGENTMNCSLCKYRSNLLGFESEVGLPQVSHHNHVEGLMQSCNLCEIECTGECDSQEKTSLNEHEHEHEHPIYPHSQHPFGPVTLRNSKRT